MTRGEKFREYREKLDMTQSEAAKALDLAGSRYHRGAAISQKETGKIRTTLRDILAIRCLWLEANWTHN